MTPARDFGAITTVTFDAAGTLLRPYPAVGAIYGAVARRHGATADDAALERGFRAALCSVFKNRALPAGAARELDFWQRIVHATFAAAGAIPVDFAACFAELWTTFARGASWRVLPDAPATLSTLRTRGYRLAVFSNWDQRLHQVLDETALRPCFDAVLISSELGADKPEPAAFHAAATALGSRPEQCLHVGDSPYHDLAGAEQAGWAGVIVRHDDVPGTALSEINHLRDLLTLLPGARVPSRSQ